MKKISRKGFLKLTAAAAMSGITAGALTACKSTASAPAASSAAAASLYTPGTYTASAKGMNGAVTATVTFDETRITKVVLDVSGETEAIGQAAKDKLIEQVMTAQTSQIDGVTGATVTSKAVQNAVADCIAQASGGAIAPAQQEATATAQNWLGQEPDIPDSEIAETISCDVLVVGAGSSGAFAAAAAVECGAKTILIEKFGHDMASGIRDTLAACGSRQQQEDGDDVDKKDAVRYLCNWSQGYTRRSLAQLWADRSGETIDWFTDRLAEGGMDFRHEIDDHTLPSNYEVLDVGHSTQYTDAYSETMTLDIILAYAEGLGLETHYETTMVKLVKEDGRVTGLIAKNAAGQYVRYNAANGVILATGGYSANEEMMLALQPHSVEQTCINYSKPGSKGDGIKACLWAGAIMDTVHTSMIFDRGAIKPDQTGEYGKASDGALFWMGSQPFLKVNLNGERFMNEYQPYDMVLHSASTQPYHTYCTIWDSKYPDDCKRFATHGCSRLYPHENGAAPVFPMEAIIGMNEGLLADGYIVQADTIEELAEKLGLPADAFAATVERYNALADAGEDEDFGKEGYRLSTLREPPYYGVRQAGGYLICTMDGIQIDETMHALDHDYKAIPGLYVIGDASGSYFAGSYPCLIAGAAAGRSATFGRLAGQNAAKGI